MLHCGRRKEVDKDVHGMWLKISVICALLSMFSMLFTCLVERLLACKPLAAASRGGSIDGSGGGKGGSGGSNENSSPGNGDEPPHGHLAWGSILIGVVLGGSMCLNLVLLGWDPKSQGKGPEAPIVDEEVYLSNDVVCCYIHLVT